MEQNRNPTNEHPMGAQWDWRDEICRVMEGGRDAFRVRYQRIMPGAEHS